MSDALRLPESNRVRPPLRRITDRFKGRWNRNSVFYDVGRYPGGRPCEVFISVGKEGTEIKDIMDALGIVTSLGLQHGVSVDDIAKALREFAPESLPSQLVHALTTQPEENR